jgi:hypothetical protein
VAILRRRKLRRLILVICLTGLAISVSMANAQEKLPLKLVATTPMPGFTGDFDHFGLDPQKLEAVRIEKTQVLPGLF